MTRWPACHRTRRGGWHHAYAGCTVCGYRYMAVWPGVWRQAFMCPQCGKWAVWPERAREAA